MHFPSPSGLACPSRSISFRNDPLWKFLEMHNFQQPDDRIWKLRYIPAHAKLPETTDYLEIKMSRDTKYNQMLSGGIVRPADLDEGGVYKVRTNEIKCYSLQLLLTFNSKFLCHYIDIIHFYFLCLCPGFDLAQYSMYFKSTCICC